MTARNREVLVLLAFTAILPGCSLAPKNFKRISDPAPLVRARSIPLSRKLPDSVVVPTLIGRLEDKDQVVRLAAYEELKTRTGKDFGFVAYGDPEERSSAIDRWKRWWASAPTGLARNRRRR